MNSLRNQYRELLSMAQLYICREYPHQKAKMVDPGVLDYFRRNYKPPAPLNHAPQQTAALMRPPMTSTRSSNLPNVTAPASPPLQTQNQKPLPQPPIKIEQTPVPQKQTINSRQPTTELHLETIESLSTARDLREFGKFYQKVFPELTVCEAIPSDAIALKLKKGWLLEQQIPPVVILSFHDHEDQLTFLKNVAQAISLRLAPARVLSGSLLEKENQWEKVLNSPGLQLIIASDYGLYLQPALMNFYSEVSQQGKHFLNKIPLLLLSDLSLYLKEPKLKSLLWRAICNEFAASPALPSAN